MDAWPASLRTAVSLLLNSPEPGLLWWGGELRQFYNDAFLEYAGSAVERLRLGGRAQEAWSDVWGLIGSTAEAVLRGEDAGGAIKRFPDLIRRNGEVRAARVAYSYTAVLDEADEVAGVLIQLRDAPRELSGGGFDWSPTRVAGGPRGSLRGAEVVLASADAELQRRLSELFAGHGATVVTLPDAEAVLPALREREPDLVVAESGVPGRSVVDLLEAIRSDAVVSDVPVILLLTGADATAAAELSERDADDYMVTPVNDRELVIRSEAALHLARLRRESCEAVRRSAAQLHLVMDAIPALVAYTDRSGRIRYFNRTFCEWTGLEAEQIQDRSLLELFGDSTYESVRERVHQALQGGPVRFETEIPCVRGGTRAVEVHYVPDTGATGEIEGYVTLVQDVSDRNRAERQLSELRDQLAQELEGMLLLHKAVTGLVQEDDVHALLLRVVEAAIAITGAKMGDIQLVDEPTGAMRFGAQSGFDGAYTNVFEAVREESRRWGEAFRRGERVVVSSGADGDTDARVPASLESQGVKAFQLTPLTTRSGRLLGMFSTYYPDQWCPTERDQRLLDLLARHAADLIERRQGNAALRESERRYAHLIESLPIGVYTCDAEGRIQMYNQAAVRMWGREPEPEDRWVGWLRIYSLDGSPMSPEDCPMAVSLREGVAMQDQEVLVERPDGARRYVLPHPVPIKDETGRVVGGVNMLLDITERKYSEETRALLAAIVASSGDGIISVALDGTIMSWNAGAERLFGYTESEMVGQNIRLLMPPETGDEQARILAEVREGRRVEHLETVRLRKDGSQVDVALTVSPVWGDSGQIIGASKIARDISVRKRNEEEIQRLNADLQARVNELQTLLDVAPVGVFIGQDPSCEVISTNRAGAAMLRLPWPSANASLTGPDSERLGWRFFQRGEEVPGYRLPLQRCASTGEEVTGELCAFVFDDGSVLHAKLSVSPLRDAEGRPRGCVATVVDVTEQIQNDAALKAANARLQTDVEDLARLHEIGTQIVREQDLPALLKSILDAAMAVSGAQMGTTQLLDQDTGELRLVAWRGFEESLVEHFESMAVPEEWAYGTASSGDRRYVVTDAEADEAIRTSPAIDAFRAAGVRAMQSTPLISRSGGLLGIFSTHWPVPHEPEDRELRMLDLLARQAADAVERSHSESVLRHLNATLEDRVRARTTELERQRLQLRKLAAELTTAEQRERRRLAALLHDDLQQLLVSAKMTLSGASRAATMADALEACARTEALIQESIDSARDMSRQLRPPVLYEDGLLPALEWLASEMEKKHELSITVDTDDAIEPEDHDLRALLFESARELLLNVVKYAGVKEASIEAVSPEEGIIQLSVSDPGHGFSLSALSGGGASGGGFGLFSIRERLAAIGGSLTIETGLGEGTTVTMEAPLYIEERPAEQFPQPASGRRRSAHRRKGKGREARVLVVDDHAVVRQGIASLIDEMPGFAVVGEANDGLEAIDLIEEEQPDVVLMDVNMPRMNGIEATRRIRHDWPDVVVVGLSVQEDEATAKSVLEAGAARFMSKTSSADEIMALLHEVLAERQTKS